MNFQKQRIATAALTVSFLGTAATLSSGGFIGSLLHHGFLASLIGGLADWFAVVALFRKPLGISYRSEILKRNKQRIMDEIVNFVVRDILSGENIMRVLKKENMAELSVTYLRDRGGKNRIMAATSEILDAWLKNIDTEKISKDITPFVKDGLFKIFERKNAEKFLELFVKNDRETLTVLANVAEEIFKLQSLQNELKSKIKEAIEEYEKDSFGRSMLVGMLDLNEDTVLREMENEFFKITKEIKNAEGENYESLRKKLPLLADEIKASKSFDEQIQKFKDYAEKNFIMSDEINKILQTQLRGNFLKKPIKKFLGDKLEEFESSEELQKNFDVWIKNFISESIEKNHGLIEKLVRERLDEFTEDEFSDFVEEKVEGDLQMIRVNGAIVGGAVGMVLYILTYASKKAFGL